MRDARDELADKTILLFVLAFCCGFFQVLFSSGFAVRWGGGWETVEIARELARRGVYGNPFHAGPSGPTAVIVPLFPIYLAALIKVLGDTPAFVMAATLFAILAQAVHAALLPRVSLIFFGDEKPGFYAGLLSAAAFGLMPQWDAPFTACALLLFFLGSDVTSWRRCTFNGAAAGLLLLTNPSSILMTGPWMVYLCLSRKASLRRLTGFAVAVSVMALPWMLRNYRQFGTFSVKSNFGMTAYVSNSDCAEASIEATIRSGCYDAMHPNNNERELHVLNQLGEAGYDRLRTADTIRWVRSHPSAFLQLTARRIVEFWLPLQGAPRFCLVVIWLATALSFPGLYLLLRRRVSSSYYMVVVAGLYPLMYYVVVSSVRYRYPLLWLSLLCAGFLLAHFARRFSCSLGAEVGLHDRV